MVTILLLKKGQNQLSIFSMVHTFLKETTFAEASKHCTTGRTGSGNTAPSIIMQTASTTENNKLSIEGLQVLTPL